MENERIWRMWGLRPYTEINNHKKTQQYITLRDPKTTKNNKQNIT